MRNSIVNILFVIPFLIVLAIGIAYSNENKSDSRRDFRENYRIDLKQEGYLVYDPTRDRTVFVQKDSLEEWFLQDNL